MDIFHTVVLALVQGLTEFLPISSDAHLKLIPILTHWPPQGLAFEVALHVGTLVAVLIYFRQEISKMFIEWVGSFKGKHTNDSRLAWGILVGTIPVGLVGLTFKNYIENNLNTPLVIAATAIIFGLLLGYADRVGKHEHDEHHMSWREIILIGCAQAVALIPGTSRSGITMTAALLLGMTPKASARFSFLLSIPVIVLAGGLEAADYLTVATASDMKYMLIGAVISALTAYATIHFFLKLLERIGMMPFVIYRIILGIVLIALYL